MGFKPLKEWNKATMPRHLWVLSKKSLFEESNFLSEHSSVVYSVKTAWKELFKQLFMLWRTVCYELLQLVWCTLLKQLGRLSEYLGCRAPWHAIVWFKKNVPRGPPLSFGYAAGKGYLPKIEC